MSSEHQSTWERRQNRAGLRDAAPAVALLVILEVAWVQVRALRRCDEYQRVLQLEALSIGFAVAMLVAMAGGLMSAVDVGSDAQYLQLTFITGIVAWVGALAIRTRH